MRNNLLRGVTTALVTPFTDEREVDYRGLHENVSFQIENGVRGLLPLGTTGETPTLTHDEQKRVVETVVEEARTSDRQPVIVVGVGTNSTQKTIDNAREAEDWGADALLVVTPYYNKPTQGGLVAHFTAIAAAVDVPIIIYNIKGRTGTNIETDTLKRIADAAPNIVAVKEASGDINQMMDVIAAIPDLAVYSGDDSMTLPLISLGGQGVISVVSNLVPAMVVNLVNCALEGDIAGARAVHYRLLPLIRAAFIETNPGPIKYAMNQRGMAAGPLRLPLVDLMAHHREKMERVLDAI